MLFLQIIKEKMLRITQADKLDEITKETHNLKLWEI